MSGESVALAAVGQVITLLQAGYSAAALREVAAAFLREHVGAEQVWLGKTAVPPSPSLLTLPVGSSGYQLQVARQAPFAAHEAALIQMMAALLAASPVFAALGAPSAAQQQLFHQLYGVITSRQTFTSAAEALQQGFTAAFPEAVAQLLLFKPEQNQLLPYVRLTPTAVADPPLVTDKVALAMATKQPTVAAQEDGTRLIFPIYFNQQVRALLLVDYPVGYLVTAVGTDTLELVAAQLGIALSNDLLLETVLQRASQLETIYRVTEYARLLKPLEPTLRDIHQQLVNIFNAPTCYIALYEAEKEVVSFPCGVYGGEFLELEPVSIFDAHSLAAWVISNNLPYATDDWLNETPPVAGILLQHVPRSLLCVPMRAGEEVLGAIAIQSDEPNAFDAADFQTLTAVADHVAVIIKNANLYAQTKDLVETGARDYLTAIALRQAMTSIGNSLEQEIVIHNLLVTLDNVVPYDGAWLFLHREGQLHFAASHSPAQQSPALLPATLEAIWGNNPLTQRILTTREAILIGDVARDSRWGAAAGQTAVGAWLGLPLLISGELLGILMLSSHTPNAFTVREERLAATLVAHAAVAIQNARLFSQAKRRVAELSTFQSIVLQLNTPLELSAVLDTITASALQLTQVNNVHIYLYDPVTQTFTFGSALWRDGRRTQATPKLRSQGITATVIRQAAPVVINDATNHPLYQSPEAKNWGICAIAGFPLKHGDEVVGAFTTTYLQPHAFTDDELLLLNLLADQAAVAVKNAHLYAESQRRLRDMSALVDMAKQVTGKLKLKLVLQTTVEILQKLLGARASSITMLSDDGADLVVTTAAGVSPEFVGRARMKVGEGVSGKVVRSGEPIYIRDAHSQPGFLFFDDIIRSLLVVPLKVRDEVIGTLTVDSDQANAFNESDIQLMTIAAAQTSVAIANARLFEELEKHAAELAAAYDELKASDRLKDELVQNVSHELRTPLTFVKGYVDLLLEGEMGLISFEQQEALQIVADKTDEITRIIGDIVTLQRIDAANLMLEEMSMAQLVKTAVANHQLMAADKGLVLIHAVPAHQEGIVLADKDRMNQVLNNLIGNALKFSPNGGTITVSMVEQDGDVCVIVSDQGIGMPEDQTERIFERFYQIDGSSRRRFSGTGLGLAIVKRIVQAHRGHIWAKSQLNAGSMFYFTLPLVLNKPKSRDTRPLAAISG